MVNHLKVFSQKNLGSDFKSWHVIRFQLDAKVCFLQIWPLEVHLETVCASVAV